MSMRRRRTWLSGGAAVAVTASLLPAAPALAAECGNAEYRTGAAAALPDCRAYEQVSPRDKRGQNVWGAIPSASATAANSASLPGWSSPDGSRVLFNTSVGPSAPEPTRGFGLYPQVTERTADGWDDRRAVVPGSAQAENRFRASGIQHFFQMPNADRSGALFASAALLAAEQPVGLGYGPGVFSARAGEAATWLSNPLWPGAVPAPGAPELNSVAQFVPVGQSDDGSTFYFMTQQALTPDDVASGRQWAESWALYRWKDGAVRNAGILPNGSIDSAGSMTPGLTLMQPGGNPAWKDVASTNRNNFTATLSTTNVVSRDGERALFLGLGGGDLMPGRVPQLYLYRDGQPTLLLSKRTDSSDPVAGSLGVTAIGMYSGISGLATHNAAQTLTLNAFADRDLGVVVFSTQDALTDDAPVATTTIKTYRYVVASNELEYLGAEFDRPALANAVRNTGNVVRMSDDGSRILFWTPSGELRLWRDGAPTVTLMTGLETSGNVSTLGARFSDDGRTVIFSSTRPSSGTIPGNPDHPTGATPLQTQVYRYEEGVDSAARCVSCPPLAAATRGPANFSLVLSHHAGFGQKGAVVTTATEERAISADGRRIYFTTNSTLDARDENTVVDVYEWSADRDGSGLALLSSGAADSSGSGLLDVDATGDNVFFVTGDRLTASDTDDLTDLYVARVGGGLPDPPPFDLESGCLLESCQPSVTPLPVLQGSGSHVVGPVTEGRQDSGVAGTPSFAVRRSRASATRATIGVAVPDAGTIRVSGNGVRTVSRRVTRASTYTVHVRLTAATRRRAARLGRTTVALRVRFAPRSGRAQTTTVRVTVKRTNSSKRGGR